MNTKLLLKTLFFIVILFLLVLMGMHNRGTVDFTLELTSRAPLSGATLCLCQRPPLDRSRRPGRLRSPCMITSTRVAPRG